AKRSPSTPDLPTIAETSPTLKDYEAGSWYGFAAPAGTSKDIVGRLNTEALKVLKLPDVKDRLDKTGFEIVYSSPQEYEAFQKNEVAKWGKIARSINLKVD